MNFNHYMPVRLITGRGCVRANAPALAGLGRKCLIVTSGSAAKKSGALDDVIAALESQGIAWTIYDKVRQNPLLLDSQEAGAQGRDFGAAFVVGIGGGSPLDAAKAAAVFAVNDIPAMDIYKKDWKNPALPLVLISTTAGTGSEVAPFSVLTKPDGRKQSVASDQIYATITFGDATYTDSLPLRFTVSTALDAMSHALEAYFNTGASAVSDLCALEAVRVLLPELNALRAVQDAAAITADTRDRLYYASVMAGMALAHCGTCYCHCLGYFLSEEHDVPHGYACAIHLPHYIQRAGRLLAGKAVRLYQAVGCTQQELSDTIQALTEAPDYRPDDAEIQAVAQRYSGSASYAHTAPDGFTAEEAVEVMRGIYGD